MEIVVVEAPPGGVEADVLVFPVPEPTALPGEALELDRALDGRLSRLVEEGELRGETGRVTLLHVDGQVAARRIAAAGVGSG
ncbi:MAG: M17 family peptidase N-terminal domain-containing protein, partial [Gaiellaceae bacterium]